MDWISESIWTLNMAEIAAHQKRQHTYFDAVATTIAAVACHKSRTSPGERDKVFQETSGRRLPRKPLNLFDHVFKG